MTYTRRISIYLLAVIIMLLIVLAAPLAMSDSNANRVHQHRLVKDGETCSHAEEVFCTHLPLVLIDTQGNTMPGKDDIGVKTMIEAHIDIVDNAAANNHINDAPDVSTLTRIRVRGHSSRFFDKSSYLLHLIDAGAGEYKTELMGMAAHDKWILNGPFLDKTLIRNYMCLNIAGEIMDYAPNVRFCELFLNGAYRGVYLMMEPVAKSIGRVNISTYDPRGVFGSYIVRMDRPEDDPNQICTLTQYAQRSGADKFIVYPPRSQISPETRRYIETDLSRFEKALYSYDFIDGDFGYRSMLDTASFVDYFLINEFWQNYDAGRYSTYMHKDIRGKLEMGPVWDFNNACDNYIETAYDATGFVMQEAPFYQMLVKDPRFDRQLISRYRCLRQTYLSEEYIQNYIDDTIAFLGEAAERNYEVWGYSFVPDNLNEYSRLQPPARNPVNYAEAVAQLKSFATQRGDWLDKNIDNLQQYGHESKTKKFVDTIK